MTQVTPPGNVTECLASREHSDSSDSVFRLIVENAVDLIVRGDAARNRTYVSPSSREILGYEPAEMLGKHAYELVHPDDLQHTQEVFGRIGPQYPCQDLTFWMRRADGTYVWIGARYRHLPADDGVLAILRDITNQKLAEQQLTEANAKLEAANAVLRNLAQIDGLTGLSNRRYVDALLDKKFRRTQREEQPLGLVLLDIDNFKGFNDRYGHLGGDDCLRRVSRCIGEAMRCPDDHVARYGGEELVILLPATDASGCAAVAEYVRGVVECLHIEHAGNRYGMVTVSAGAAAARPYGLGWTPWS